MLTSQLYIIDVVYRVNVRNSCYKSTFHFYFLVDQLVFNRGNDAFSNMASRFQLWGTMSQTQMNMAQLHVEVFFCFVLFWSGYKGTYAGVSVNSVPVRSSFPMCNLVPWISASPRRTLDSSRWTFTSFTAQIYSTWTWFVADRVVLWDPLLIGDKHSK